MKQTKSPAWPGAYLKATTKVLIVPAILLSLSGTSSQAEGPLAAKINVTSLQSYSGSDPLPKPNKILIYDFTINPSDIQVDESQKIRPRHMVTGDENPEAIAKKMSAKFANELVTRLAKTGIAVEHVTGDASAPENTLAVQGAFSFMKQGDKLEREGVGTGAGSADVQAKVDVQLKTASNDVMLSQFQTDTKPAENVGGALPAAAGLDPAAIAVKSKVTDREKTLDAYVAKTADAMAEEITKQMAKQGWVKLDDKGKVVP